MSNENFDSNDQQFENWLDDQLREISVPDELVQKLAKLPKEQPLGPEAEASIQDETSNRILVEKSSSNEPTRGTKTRRQSWNLLLAATCASILFLFGLSSGLFFPANSPSLDDSPIDGVTADAETKKYASRAIQLENEIAALKLASKKRRMLRSLRLEENIGNVISIDEVASITLAAANQTALDLGANKQTVSAELEIITQKFPKSSGSKLAKQILKELQP